MVREDYIVEIIVNRELVKEVIGLNALDEDIEKYKAEYSVSPWKAITSSFAGCFGYHLYLNEDTFETATVVWRSKYQFRDKNNEVIYCEDSVIDENGEVWMLRQHPESFCDENQWLYLRRFKENSWGCIDKEITPKEISEHYTVKHCKPGKLNLISKK